MDNLQVILSTHSPLLLGDIPANNVMYLGTQNDEGPTIRNTFGQNIHTILKDSFFLKNGIGSFAAEKINAVAKLLNEKEKLSSEELQKCKMIIDLVAPGILKSKLMELYSDAVGKNEKHVNEKIMNLARELNPEEIRTIVSMLQKEIERHE